jgi:acyl-[acyl-carrier-protein] desaturase
MLFYRNLLGAALQVAPNQTMRAIVEVVKSFEMPGASIENFTRKSVQIALSGIYDLRLHHDDVIAPVLRAWGVYDLEGLDEEGEKARTELDEILQELQRQAARFEDKRETHRAKLAARGQTLETV